MNRLRIIPLDDMVVFPGMPITLPVDVGSDDRVLLVPRRDNTYSKVGIVAEVSERMRLAGRGVSSEDCDRRHAGRRASARRTGAGSAGSNGRFERGGVDDPDVPRLAARCSLGQAVGR